MKTLLAIFTLFSLHLCCPGAMAYPAVPAKGIGSLTMTTVVIPSGGTTSSPADLAGYTLVGMKYGTMTGTAITYTMSETKTGTYVAVKNSSGAVSTTVADDEYLALDPANFRGIQYIKLVSGSSEAADRTVTLFLKAM